MKSSVETFTVTHGNTALLDFLAERLSLSRKKAKALLDERAVLVNSKRVWMARHLLERGDIVEAVMTGDTRQPGKSAPRILFENDDYIVVDKPPGVLSNGPRSVEEVLRAELRLPRFRVAHRLDRDTSGCLLAARTARAFDAAVELFRNRRIRKLYHAVVHGSFRVGDRSITFPLEGQKAVTTVRRLDASREASHLLIEIETGRTHQIRKHLAGLGHPVLGDREHGLRVAVSDRARRLPRQMLHASDLQFGSPLDGSDVKAHSPLPADFRRCLREMGLK